MYETSEAFPMAREPVLRRMPDGTLFSSLYTGGPIEPHPDNIVGAIRSEDDGETWSQPEVLFKHPRRSNWPSEVFTGGDLPMLGFQTYLYDTGFNELKAYFSTTSDSGRTWSEPRTYPGVPANFSMRRIRVLADGTWLAPIYWPETRGGWDCDIRYDYEGAWPGMNGLEADPNIPESQWKKYYWIFVCGVLRSTDRGARWSLHGHLTIGEKFQAWEPEVIELAPGHLKMFIRCETPEHLLWESTSHDGGLTWSDPRPGTLSNPGSKVTIYRVDDLWVMANNFCTPDQANRDNLELAVSRDGENWPCRIPVAQRHLKEEPGWESAYQPGCRYACQVAYPDGFTDDTRQTLYLTIDGGLVAYLVKIPYAAIHEEWQRQAKSF